jgi:hypothetical protein
MARELLVSPLGEAEWAKVIQPGKGYEAADPDEWTIDLVLDPGKVPAHLDFIARLEFLMQEEHGKAKVAERGWPFRDHKEKPGLVVVKFKRRTVTKKGNEVPPPVVIDARKQPWNGDLIGNGSKVKVGFTVYGWDRKDGCGISLELVSLQVIDLVPFEQADPTSAFGEEDGYTVPEAEATAGFVNEAPAAAAPTSFADRFRKPAVDEDIPF